jgi:ABC-type ATPase involved in cell division
MRSLTLLCKAISFVSVNSKSINSLRKETYYNFYDYRLCLRLKSTTNNLDNVLKVNNQPSDELKKSDDKMKNASIYSEQLSKTKLSLKSLIQKYGY